MTVHHGKLENQDLASLLILASELSSVRCESAFTNLVQRLARILPIESAYCGVVRLDSKGRPISLESVYTNNVVQGWLDSYVNGSLFESDPVLRNFVCGYEQQVWSSIYSDLSRPKDRAFLEAAKSFGLDRGITQGVFSRRHSMASVFALAGPQLENDERHQMVLDTLNPFLHLALMRFYFGGQEDLPSLSKRELEVLQWMKEGKTNWEISRILEISERTAKYHVENILGKFQVSTRTHAVALAVSGGIIHQVRTRGGSRSAPTQKRFVPGVRSENRADIC